jgi:hypothetical protein
MKKIRKNTKKYEQYEKIWKNIFLLKYSYSQIMSRQPLAKKCEILTEAAGLLSLNFLSHNLSYSSYNLSTTAWKQFFYSSHAKTFYFCIKILISYGQCQCFLVLFTTESWFEIWRPIVICLFFCFVSPEVKTSRNLFFPIPLPFTCSRWRFSRPFHRALFYCFYVTLPLIRGLRNFASFSPAWPQQPFRMVSLAVRSLFKFARFSCCLVYNLIVCFRLC